jgi:hypothetical protein
LKVCGKAYSFELLTRHRKNVGAAKDVFWCGLLEKKVEFFVEKVGPRKNGPFFVGFFWLCLTSAEGQTLIESTFRDGLYCIRT